VPVDIVAKNLAPKLKQAFVSCRRKQNFRGKKIVGRPWCVLQIAAIKVAKFWANFSANKNYVLILTQKWVGLHFGQFFRKLTWQTQMLILFTCDARLGLTPGRSRLLTFAFQNYFATYARFIVLHAIQINSQCGHTYWAKFLH
jgi:hypothetical protein